MKKYLSKLNRVDLRDVWGHESIDFTNWLAQEENLSLLSEEIGIDIKLIKTEANVGKFNVDILAEEENSNRKIIIENQLENTNHDHLGKIITYAAGYDAEIIIWIVRDAREEHQKAVEWLNEHTDEKIGFFLIKLELWQIEGSNPAAKFDVLASPNEWAKIIKAGTSGDSLTNTKLQQLDFWSKFKEYVQKHDARIRLQTPRPQHWYDVSIGTSIAHITLTINSRENLLGCEIYINKNKPLFNYLHDKQSEIEKEIGEKMNWVDARVDSRIRIIKQVPGVFNQIDAEKYYDWLCKKIIVLQKVFGKYCKDFKKTNGL